MRLGVLDIGSNTVHLLIVDAYSKWPEIIATERITATATVRIFADMVARYGAPNMVMTDNGTQFTSSEFNDFCAENGIEHKTSAPYHPQSNGQVERFVDSFKRSLLKMKGEYPVPDAMRIFLQTYRQTPSVVCGGRTPAELFLGRRVRTRIDLIVPVKRPEEGTTLTVKMKKQFDQKHGVKDRRYRIGDTVLYKEFKAPNGFRWSRGVVTAKKGRVMYEVKLDSRLVRAHANQLRLFDGAESEECGKIPLTILLDTYGLHNRDENEVTIPSRHVSFEDLRGYDVVRDPNVSDSPVTAAPQSSVTPQYSRPVRDRKQTQRLIDIIDPSRKKY